MDNNCDNNNYAVIFVLPTDWYKYFFNISRNICIVMSSVSSLLPHNSMWKADTNFEKKSIL